MKKENFLKFYIFSITILTILLPFLKDYFKIVQLIYDFSLFYSVLILICIGIIIELIVNGKKSRLYNNFNIFYLISLVIIIIIISVLRN